MPDIVSAAVRSRMMAGIKGKDTKPEMLVRRGLFARGFRFRLHDKRLPGRPDLVLPRYRAAIQVNGCFWHGHNCALFKWPDTRRSFWEDKIRRNRLNDERTLTQLREAGWRVMTVWECALRGPTRMTSEDALSRIAAWLMDASPEAQLLGDEHDRPLRDRH